MRPPDLIEGMSADVPGAYVIGSYDTRITIYSQQVRALELAFALDALGHIRPAARVAVVGAGAAGVTMAAALALRGDVTVLLLEGADEVMPLQRDARRRHIDPHIYGWPAPDAEHEAAQLPLLDWVSGSASQVREDILTGFGAVCRVARERLLVLTDHRVLSVRPRGASFEVEFDRAGLGGGRETAWETVDLVVLAFGFGLEREQPLPGVRTASYWSDAGVPGAEIAANPHPSFLVSGNGDGGLIDLVAAADRDFNHGEMIRTIVRRPGVDQLREPLLDIDRCAREADADRRGFDFVAAYDDRIGEAVARLGLVEEVSRRLRRGVRLFLQTKEADVMSIRTATLNRLATYLVGKACQRGLHGERFEHLACANVRPVPGASGGGYAFEVDGGRRIEVDRVIVRRGPDRGSARMPFADLLANHEAEHNGWVRRFSKYAIAPSLSAEAMAHFEEASRRHSLPLPRYRSAEATANPSRIRVKVFGDLARWTGDLPIEEAVRVWGAGAPPMAISMPDVPATLGPLAYALTRLALHADRSVMHVDVVHWTRFVERLTSRSMTAEDLEPPSLQPARLSSILNGVDMRPTDMAASLHAAMDRAVLGLLDEHMTAMLARAEDRGRLVSFVPAADLRRAMEALWADWSGRFAGDPTLLARFLRLVVCASDTVGNSEEARMIVGPRKKRLVVRAVAVALAVASAWHGLAPHVAEPGNLSDCAERAPRTGHVCAADLIDGEQMALRAVEFAWRTSFVLLPMVNQAMDVSVRAGLRMDSMDGLVPRLDQVDASPNLFLTVDRRLRMAIEAGMEPLRDLLVTLEDGFVDRLRSGIEVAQGDPA